MAPYRDPMLRFEDFVMPEPNSGCWLWMASLNSGGYGKFKVNKCSEGAHRWIYEQVVGKIPHGLHLDHLCRVRSCVNPAHLEPVTQKENNLRGFGAAGLNARKTHCLRGHILSGDNLQIRPDGGRTCRKCRRDSRRTHYKRSSAARQAA